MPDVIPTGPLSIPFEQAAIIFAACPAFRSVCGVASAAEAREFIYYPYYDKGANDDKWPIPGIIIDDDDLNAQFMNRNRDQGGSLLVTFCFPVTYADQPENQILDFRNKLGSILTEMLTLANTPNPDSVDGIRYINIVKWEKANTPAMLGKPFATENMMHAAFVIEWVS